MQFLTNLAAYKINGQNPIAVDENGYIYANTEEYGIYRTQDIFLPLMYMNITSGDKYIIGFSNKWPCLDTGTYQYVISGNGTDLVVGSETPSISITRYGISTVTSGIFKVAYYGTITSINGNEVSGLGLRTNTTELGAQTWKSATQNLEGSVYLLKAVPYIVINTLNNNGNTYAVNIYTNVTGATVTINGITYNNGDTVNLANGTYTVTANAPDGYKFDHWVTIGISIADYNSQSTTITVNGAGGSLEAYFVPDSGNNTGNNTGGNDTGNNTGDGNNTGNNTGGNDTGNNTGDGNNTGTGGAGDINTTAFNNFEQFIIKHILSIFFCFLAMAALFNNKFKIFIILAALAFASYLFIDAYAAQYIIGGG